MLMETPSPSPKRLPTQRANPATCAFLSSSAQGHPSSPSSAELRAWLVSSTNCSARAPKTTCSLVNLSRGEPRRLQLLQSKPNSTTALSSPTLIRRFQTHKVRLCPVSQVMSMRIVSYFRPRQHVNKMEHFRGNELHELVEIHHAYQTVAF